MNEQFNEMTYRIGEDGDSHCTNRCFLVASTQSSRRTRTRDQSRKDLFFRSNETLQKEDDKSWEQDFWDQHTRQFTSLSQFWLAGFFFSWRTDSLSFLLPWDILMRVPTTPDLFFCVHIVPDICVTYFSLWSGFLFLRGLLLPLSLLAVSPSLYCLSVKCWFMF